MSSRVVHSLQNILTFQNNIHANRIVMFIHGQQQQENIDNDKSTDFNAGINTNTHN